MKQFVRLGGTCAYLTALVLLAALLNVGCGRSPAEAARFAQAGTTYTTALDLLLVRSGEIGIDANSEFIISKDTQSNFSPGQYEGFRDADREKLKVLNRLRAHTKLLARYFELLYELSTSKKPEETATAIEGTVGNINQLGTEVRGSGLITPGANTAISQVTQLIVTAKIRKAVNAELTARNQTIRKELVTQEELLKILADDIKHNLQITNLTREKRLVIEPLIAAAPLVPGQIDQWKLNRKAAITAHATIDDLENASKAVEKLRKAYESLLDGKLDINRINDALNDFELIIATAEALKKVTGE